MGVKGLQSYMEKCCPEASPIVKIAELAEKRRSSNDDEELVAVVDGSNCIREIYGDLEWIGGAQYKQFAEQAKLFVDKFEKIGIRLVFFFDGPTVERKRRTWVERRYNTVEKMYYVLDQISYGERSSAIPKSHFHLPPGMGQVARIVFQVICGCEVYQSLAECDEEIADYARKNKAFAIIGQDTDYVILDCGEALYLSIKHLDLDLMTTRLYDRRQLAQSLGIDVSLLPFLATFMGNDIVPADDLKPFHLKITRSRSAYQRVNFATLVPHLVFYTRSLPLGPNFLNDKRLLSGIAQTTLGDYNRDYDIRDSLLSYDTRRFASRAKNVRKVRDPWLQLVALAKDMHVKHQIPSMVYAIMSGLPYETSSSVEDYRMRDLPTVNEATYSLRRRVYGILLQEKLTPDRHYGHIVTEWCMSGRGSLDGPTYVCSIPPDTKHPGLKALWTKRTQYQYIRWHLFLNVISPALDVAWVRSSVPRYLLTPMLVLRYVQDTFGCFVPSEVDAALATAVCLKNYTTAQLAALPADPMSTRGIRMSNLIMRFTSVFYVLLASCGYPFSIEESAPWLFFDGKLFQYKYLQSQAGSNPLELCEYQDENLRDFNLVRPVIPRWVDGDNWF